ncbi:MAG TPA: hypothetical protein VFF84_06965 [Sphingobium sp.]|nr:hypothetical protein [Sphingobium sp.]
MKHIMRTKTIMLVGAALPLLAGCGANEIASPGTGGNVTINPPPTSTPSPTPTPAATVTPAGGCPTLPAGANPLVDRGVTAETPTGVWRICELPATINQSITLTKVPGLLYSLPGRVDVGCDRGFSESQVPASCTLPSVTLKIEPGVILYGATGQSWLAVNRGNKIDAVGTETKPIIFTSRDNVLGINTDSSMGQWGGVVLMGRAKITDCTYGSVAAGTCERDTEGSADPAIFGGADDTDSSGRMKYVQIRYSGFVLGKDVELQALTTEGIGSGTELAYIQTHNSSDDGAEFFGGVVNVKHYIATGADDDSLDVDTGARANFQHVLLIQRPGAGDALMEIDSNGKESDTPRTNLKVVNFTAIQGQVSSNNEANDQASILLRGNSDTTFANGIVVTPNNECLRLHGTGSLADRATLVAHSTVLTCNSTKFIGSGAAGVAYTASDIAAIFAGNGNNDVFSTTLSSLFVNGANESQVAAFDAKTLDAFFDTTTHIGAVKDANDGWFKGWTCNSTTATFDDAANGNRACTSLPIA